MIGSILSVVLVLLSFIIYHVTKSKMDYWEKRKIPYMKPLFLLGNYAPHILMYKYVGEIGQWICKKYPDAPIIGAFYGTEPVLIVQDPEMLKQIMTKDFYYFNGREISNHTHRESIFRSVFAAYGDRWKVIRQNLTPLFTSSKMKNMFYMIEKCSHVFESVLDREILTSNFQEIRPLMARFTMDCIGVCAFGINTQTMEKNAENNKFTVMGRMIFSNSYTRAFKMHFRAIWPDIFYGLGMKLFPVEVDDFFHDLLTKVFKERQYKPSSKNDFVDLILNLKKNHVITGDSLENFKGDHKKVSIQVNDEMLVSQSVVFFAAGYETSATTLQYTLYQLAKDQKAQGRAIEEIDKFLERRNNKLVYECVTELPYLEACIDETLRLTPILGMLTREVMEPYQLPNGAILDKGLRVHIPVYHIHHNPKHFPDPEVFQPERFVGEKRRKIKPFTYLPFGEGPRICIGNRFAKMQMLAGLVTVLKKYRVELADYTPRKLKFQATSVVTQPKEAIKLIFIERDGWHHRLYA